MDIVIDYKRVWESLKDRVLALKAKDTDFKVFGAKYHKYQAGNCLSEAEIVAFEQQYQIRLPEDYRTYLQYFGNGGVGKDYGIIPLQRTVITQLDKPFKLTKPYFPDFDIEDHYECNPQTYEMTYFYKSREDFIQKIYETEQVYNDLVGNYYANNNWTDAECEHYDSLTKYTGTLWITDEGCGHITVLVVCGTEYGNLWGDSMVSDYGIFPHACVARKEDIGYQTRIDFMQWYVQWLSKAEQEVSGL